MLERESQLNLPTVEMRNTDDWNRKMTHARGIKKKERKRSK